MAVRRTRNGTVPIALVEDASPHGRAAAGEDELRPAVHGVCALAVLVEGTAPLLMHRYDVAAIEHRFSAPKGSVQRRTEDPEEYLYRDPYGLLSIPATNVKRCFSSRTRPSRPRRRQPHSPVRAQGAAVGGRKRLGAPRHRARPGCLPRTTWPDPGPARLATPP